MFLVVDILFMGNTEFSLVIHINQTHLFPKYTYTMQHRRRRRISRLKRNFNYFSLKQQVDKMLYGFYLKNCRFDQIINDEKNILKFRLWNTKKPVMTHDENVYTMILMYLNINPDDPDLNIQKLEDVFCKIKNISPYIFLNFLNFKDINSIKIKTHFLTQLMINTKLKQYFPEIIEIAVKNDIDFVVDYLHGLNHLANDHDFVFDKYINDFDKISYLLKIGYELSLQTFIKVASKHPTLNIPNYDNFINQIINDKKQSVIINLIGSFGSLELYNKLKSNGWIIKNTNIDKLYQRAVNKYNMSLAKKIIIENPKKKWMVKKIFEKLSKCKPNVFDKYSKDINFILKTLNYKSFDDSLYPLIHKKQILDYPMENNNYHLSNPQISRVFYLCCDADNLDILKKLINNRIIDPIDLSKQNYLLNALENSGFEIAKYLMTDLKLRCTDKEVNSIVFYCYSQSKFRFRRGSNQWNIDYTKKILELLVTVGGYKPSSNVCEKFVTNYDLFIWILNNGGEISRQCFKKSITNPNRLKVAKFLFKNKEKYNQDTKNIIQYILQNERHYRRKEWSLESIIKIIKEFNITVDQTLITQVIKISRVDLLQYFVKKYKLIIPKQDAVSYFMDKPDWWLGREWRIKMVKYLINKSGLDLSDINWTNINTNLHNYKIHKIINSKYDIDYTDEFITKIIKNYQLKMVEYIIKNTQTSISKNNIFEALMIGWTKGIKTLISHSKDVNFTIKDMNTMAINSCRYSIAPVTLMAEHFDVKPTVYTLELLVLTISPFAHHQLIPLIKSFNFVTQRIVDTLTGDAQREALRKPVQEYQIPPEEIPDIMGENPHNNVFQDDFVNFLFE